MLINKQCALFLVSIIVPISILSEEIHREKAYLATTRNCSARCKGSDCIANCRGTMSDAEAIGFNAEAIVYGDLATSECFGPFCRSICDGVMNVCMSKCGGRGCVALAVQLIQKYITGNVVQSKTNDLLGVGKKAYTQGNEENNAKAVKRVRHLDKPCKSGACLTYSEGTASVSNCMGHKCNANCTGDRCISECEGTNCFAECHSKQCRARCDGAACSASCTGHRCEHSQS